MPRHQLQKIIADEAAAGDFFGHAVAIEGDTAIISADTENGSTGAVYIFTRSGNEWTQQQKLVASDATAADNFGHSVAIDGDTIAIGALQKTIGGLPNAGAVYIFTRSGGTWSQQQRLTATTPVNGGNFGASVAIDGDTMMIGSQFGGGSLYGAVYYLTRSGNTWTEQQELLSNETTILQRFGSSVDIDGDTVVIGEWANGGAPDPDGAIHIFEKSGSTWTRLQRIDAYIDKSNFGWDVAIRNDLIMASAPDPIASSPGYVYYFTRSGNTWSLQQRLEASDGANGNQFGHSIAFDGDTAIIGAPAIGASDDLGDAYIFTRSGNTWTEQQSITARDIATGDDFGFSVALDGDTVLVGAESENSNTGAVYGFNTSTIVATTESYIYNRFRITLQYYDPWTTSIQWHIYVAHLPTAGQTPYSITTEDFGITEDYDNIIDSQLDYIVISLAPYTDYLIRVREVGAEFDDWTDFTTVNYIQINSFDKYRELSGLPLIDSQVTDTNEGATIRD